MEVNLTSQTTRWSPLPSPSLPITALTVLRSRRSFHFLPLSPESSLPGKWTLLAALADNTLTAYDLDEQCVNHAVDATIFTLPTQFLRAADPISSMCFDKKHMRWIVANRDVAISCQLPVEKEGIPAKIVDPMLQTTMKKWKRDRIQRLLE